jgi:hypothetical protein
MVLYYTIERCCSCCCAMRESGEKGAVTGQARIIRPSFEDSAKSSRSDGGLNA